MKLIVLALVAAFSLSASAQWKNESALSVIKTGGNTRLETYDFNTKHVKKSGNQTYTLGGHYILGTTENRDSSGNFNDNTVETARNWDVFGRFGQDLSSKFSIFAGIQFEGNQFAGFNQRNNYDLGGKYKFVATDKVNSFATLAYRYTTEQLLMRNTDGDTVFNDNKVAAFYQFDKIVREGFSYKVWAEYVYNFTRTEDFLFNIEPSVALAMNDTFSIKVAYKAMYDNQPATEGFEQWDTQFTTSLLARF